MPQLLSETRAEPHAAAPFRAPAVRTRASEADHAACAEMIRGGSKSFYAASLILPRRVRRPAYALYAFCRLADDAVDLATARGAPERLAARLGRLYAGRPHDHPADRALAEVVAAHRIPAEIPGALLEGLAWDEAGRRYETLADVEAYSARVAATVGVMMTLLMGERRPEVLARACDLGVAMQLSNIARDVGEDARAGRLYLPRGWLRAEGIEPAAFLADPRHSPALGRVVTRLLAHAEALYDRAAPGIAALPRDCRPGIGAARILYREIGRTVAANGCNSVDARAYVPAGRKAVLLPRAFGPTLLGPLGLSAQNAEAAPLAAVRFLIDAVTEADRMAPLAGEETDRLSRALDIFVAASLHASTPRRFMGF